MSDIIKLLPDSVANQIAAGEVIQRPASVVKELVENAVDAGADNISVIIKDAGRTLIQVVDNGCGMSEMDARMAFERHSTSKITAANDLFSLHTMGFRGEALASIAAVAQVELKTMRHDDTIGTQILISGSRVESQQPVATAAGSNMMVKNLFFNVPARRKFLKKDSVELSNIMHEFERLALVNPDLELSLIHNGATLHQLMKGTLKQRIGALFGKSIERQLIPIETETSIVKINGFVGLPENARRRGALQYLFVNGRNMRHPYFHKAVMHCYEQLIRADEQPCYFINFEVDPATIDVNIHPTKNEIKFENEQPIWQILVASIRESLGKYNVGPAMDFDATDAPEIPSFNPAPTAMPNFGINVDYNPFDNQNDKPKSGGGHGHIEKRPRLDDWESLYRQFSGDTGARIDTGYNPFNEGSAPIVASRSNDVEIPSLATGDETLNDVNDAPTLMQLKNKYILAQSRNGLLLFDQHRAHLLILFNRYISRDDAMSLPSQKVMFPEVLSLSPDRSIMLNEILPEVSKFGYELTPMGDNKWSIDGVPSAEVNDSHADLLTNIIDDIAEGNDVTREAVKHSVSLSLARSGAIRAGRKLNMDEMESLYGDLMSQPSPGYTPDGNKIIAEISLEKISAMF